MLRMPEILAQPEFRAIHPMLRNPCLKLMELTQMAPLCCDRPQASESDRCIRNLLCPHLAQTEVNKLEGSQIQQLLTQFKQALDQGE
jgi:hypothetical protein